MIPAISRQIGARLRDARLRARYSADEAARFCRVGKPKLLAWEAGAMQPSADELGRLARLLGVTPGRLLPPAAMVMAGIDATEALAVCTATPAPPKPRQTTLGGRVRGVAPRMAPLRCDACGRWFSARPCVHRQPEAASAARSPAQGQPEGVKSGFLAAGVSE